MRKYINLNIPPIFEIIIFKKKESTFLYLYNKSFKIILPINSKHAVQINKSNNFLKIHKNIINNKNLLINNKINILLKNLNIYNFIKIKFKGKGFKLGFYKKKKILNFFFGFSHINYIIFKNTIIKKINKYKFLIKNVNIKILNKCAKKIINIKKLNKYTLRGLRCSKQIIIKRKGRKGVFF